MKGHRAAAVHAASQTETHKKLEESRDLSEKLKQMQQLKEGLENQTGNAGNQE